jgi:hypothetical protein
MVLLSLLALRPIERTTHLRRPAEPSATRRRSLLIESRGRDPRGPMTASAIQPRKPVLQWGKQRLEELSSTPRERGGHYTSTFPRHAARGGHIRPLTSTLGNRTPLHKHRLRVDSHIRSSFRVCQESAKNIFRRAECHHACSRAAVITIRDGGPALLVARRQSAGRRRFRRSRSVPRARKCGANTAASVAQGPDPCPQSGARGRTRSGQAPPSAARLPIVSL